jgi:uncharacterized protein YeaC (DUF1315 family)
MFRGRNVEHRTQTALLFGTCIAALICAGAVAQPGGGREGPLTPETTAKAETLEVTTVSQSLSLPADKMAKLAEAYKTARESHAAAMRAMMKPGERPDFSAMQQTTKAETAKFETAIKAFLTPEQTATALATLGTFNRRWDRMVLVIDGMGLAEKPRDEVMKVVMNSVAESSKAMQAMTASTDREAMRTQQEKMRENLDASLAKVLSEDQMKKWKEETSFRPRGPRMGPGNAPAPPGPGPKPETPPPAK